MITSYYTLKALAACWNQDLTGCIVGDAYSQSRDELTLALASPETTWMLRCSTRLPFQYLFRSEGYNKARRNVATLFRSTFDRNVLAVRIAERDRMLYLDLDDGSYFQFVLFGPRANVLLVDPAGVINDAFQRRDTLGGQPAPLPVAAPAIDSFEAFEARWRSDRSSVAQSLASAIPFFDRTLAQEASTRADLSDSVPSSCTAPERRMLFDVSKQLQKELEQPSPRIYWKEDRAVQFSLAELTTYAHLRPEPFSSVDKGLQVFVRRKLGQHAFESVFEPLERALRSARDQYRSRLETMLNSMAEESRADRYERWGHLLMASQSAIPPHTEEIEVDDLYEENMRTTIPLDPGLNGIENAEKYYEKARQTRKARRHAEDRLLLTEARAAEADGLWQELQGLQSRPEVLQFEKLNAERLAPYLGQQASEAVQQVPFRRFILSSGFEVWVGKNARQNDTLTFVHARKFDFWLHARGVSGSHTLLRRPGRTTMPDKRIKQQAASIAAYFSKARGSHLVPVIMAEKKYVRKPRGAAPGAVIVEKEEVLLVEPGLP